MSRENLESVEAFIASFNRGDESALTDFLAEDVEIDWSRSPAPYRGIYRGREAALAWFDDVGDTFKSGRIEAVDLIDADDEILVPHVMHLCGRDGLEVKVRASYVFTIRGGRCARWRIYQEHDHALADLGLAA
jgi:ketosteroid isomerase-like protein